MFPQYDWLSEIVGESEKIELSLIIQNGTDPHSYEPTAADILAISKADMIVYLGGESDKWVSEALERSDNKDIVRVELSKCEGVELHDISSASEGHSHGGHDHGHHDHEGHDHGTLDEHIWLSLNNAKAACKALAEEVSALDENSAKTYAENAKKYIERLDALDGEYKKAVESIAQEERFLLFCDRFPFVYLLEDYGIEYAAAFEGCSADADADFETVLRLIKEADEHSLSAVAVTESSDRALARTVLSSSAQGGGEIIVFNSLQSVNKGQIAEGISYLSVMEDNLKALRRALGI
jgi:zinc transport system substrate-binding protein